MTIVQGLFLLCFPAVIVWVLRRYSKIGFLSPILLCYLAGMIIANVPLLDRELSQTVAEIAIPLAIPLLLFSTHFSRWLGLAKKMVLSFVLILFSAMVSAFGAAMIFASRVEDFWKIGGMLVGVYTGGTPNMMAVGLALDVPRETYVLVHTADVLIGGLYIVFLIFAAKPLLSRFLPPFKLEGAETDVCLENKEEKYRALGPGPKVLKTAAALGMALVILGAAAGVSMLIAGGLAVIPVILIVTTLGIACSFVTRIREAEAPYTTGHYLLLVFSLAIGSTIQLDQLLAGSATIFLFTAAAMMGAIILHIFLAFLFRIDADTTLITSTAGIYGPPFVAPVAAALKNREVLVPGLLCGLVGYALGNYLGLAVAHILTLV